MDIDKIYDETLDLLKEAIDGFKTVTNNQLGMPGHLMHVSRLFGEAKDNITKLEKEAKKQSNKWYRGMHNMNSNSNNNNNNSKTRKRKRNNA